jgi:16S rRNA processing protein RimM
LLKGKLNIIGKIIKLSGKNGELVVLCPALIENPDQLESAFFIELENEFVPFFIEKSTPINNEKAVIKFEAVNENRKAEKLVDHSLLCEADPELKIQTFDQSILGWEIWDVSFGFIGKIKTLDENPKNPLMIVAHAKADILIPFQENFILNVDARLRKFEVDCPPGLISLYLNQE